MKKTLLMLAALATSIGAFADAVTAKWEFSDTLKLDQVQLTGDQTAIDAVTTTSAVGNLFAKIGTLTASGADEGLTPVTYTPPFTSFEPSKKVSDKTEGLNVSFTVTPKEGHTFKPNTIAFDAVKIGTDGGGIEVYYTIGDEAPVLAGTATPLRNKVTKTNPDAWSHHEIALGSFVVDGKPFKVDIYIMNLALKKALGLRNIIIDGATDEDVCVVKNFFTKFTCKGVMSQNGAPESIDLLSLVGDLKNGENTGYKTKLFGDPSDFEIETVAGYRAEYTYEGRAVHVNLMKDDRKVMTFSVRFKVSNMQPKGPAKPLNRGLMSLSLTGAKMGTGNLVSWRHREADGYGVKYKLYRGDEAAQTEVLNEDLYIIDRTNYEDKTGTVDHFYRLETYDKTGKLIDSEVSRQTWANQTYRIPLQTPASRGGASYTPNDASYCDMDGDGEYEIILKWSPSNEKDAASSGATSPIYLDCIKMDGTLLWRIDAGPNFFTSAHTMQFIAWDFDGDGYGELMMKTAPGTIDGEGNYVLLGDDDPFENLLSGRGKQDHGSEYITVFDGLTGGELATIPYHTDYATGLAVWGDSNQNRSERYLAGLAYLDGPDANPSPIFSRGYYSGAFVGAYDWDGKTLKERWVSRNTTKGQGLWGEGAHWVAMGDCDGDGKHEIVFGSAALDHDGSLLYRTGLGHGDALHLGDFLPEREGLEVFMVHEEKPYGYDLRDAATGERLLYKTAGGDTGRGIAAHFDANYPHSQFSHSAEPGMHDCVTGDLYVEGWNPGGGGMMNNRIYWTGDLYDEHYDKSVIAKWNGAGWDRVQVNKTNYTVGTLNNYTKYNPCVLGDFLGDWREEIILWEGTAGSHKLVINATSYPTEYRIPHLMDDLNYRVQVVNQNCCYNQPPHLMCDPSVKYAGNPNRALQENVDADFDSIEDIEAGNEGEEVIYNLQGIRLDRVSGPGLYIINGKKVLVK